MFDINLNVKIGFTDEAAALLTSILSAATSKPAEVKVVHAKKAAKEKEPVKETETATAAPESPVSETAPSAEEKAAVQESAPSPEEKVTAPETTAVVGATVDKPKLTLEDVRKAASWFNEEKSRLAAIVPKMNAIGIDSVAKCPKEKYQEFMELLEKTKSEIING